MENPKADSPSLSTSLHLKPLLLSPIPNRQSLLSPFSKSIDNETR